MQTMIQSAENFLDEYIKKESIPWSPDIEKLYGAINTAMIEFTKQHVQYALKQASEKADLIFDDGQCEVTEAYSIDINSILNAYPLINIV